MNEPSIANKKNDLQKTAQKANNHAAEVVALRNRFYQDSYRTLLLILVLSFTLNLILVGLISYVITHPPAPKYFATTSDGRITPLIALDQPNLSTSAVLQWANTAAVASYTYNFVNYRSELQAASEFFTPDGWSDFLNALETSTNLSAVKDKKLVVSAVATGAPVVLQQGLLDGRYSWRVQMPILATYQSASEISRQNILLTMLIQRVSSLNSARGIGIAQFIAQSEGSS